jgi:hypothetical protein
MVEAAVLHHHHDDVVDAGGVTRRQLMFVFRSAGRGYGEDLEQGQDQHGSAVRSGHRGLLVRSEATQFPYRRSPGA